MLSLRDLTLLALALRLSACSSPAKADDAVTAEVLSAETAIVSFWKGEMAYIHLAGVICDQEHVSASQAKKRLESLVLGKKIDVLPRLRENNHIVATVYAGNTDVAAELIRDGFCQYRAENFLGAVQKSLYPVLEDKARLSRTGIWQDPNFTADAQSRRNLRRYLYDQPYFNGTPQPSREDFNRPSLPAHR